MKPHIHAVRFSESPTLNSVSVHQLLEQHTSDGIFCSDDLTALLVLQEARKLNIDVPSQLKVIGFDGSKLNQTYHPELSTIVQPIKEIAELLTELKTLNLTQKQINSKSQLKFFGVKQLHTKI